MKVLVVGGSGFVGSNIVNAINKKGWYVDYPSSDLLNLESTLSIDNYLKNKYYDAIFYCAIKKTKDDFFEKNCHNLMNLLKFYSHFAKWCHISSRAVYDYIGSYSNITPIQINESFDNENIGEYSRLKIFEEKIVTKNCKNHFIFRLFDTYDDISNSGPLPRWKLQYLRGELVGNEVLSPIKVSNATEIIVECSTLKHPKIMNICGLEHVSSFSVISKLFHKSNNCHLKDIEKTGLPSMKNMIYSSWESDFDKYLKQIG